MKNKKIKEEKKDEFNEWLLRNIRVLTDLYGIGSVSITLTKRGEAIDASGMDNTGIPFKISYMPAYKSASIYYYQPAIELFEKKRFDILTQALTHEVAHILTEKLADLALERFVSKREIDSEVESLTETIAQLGRKLLVAKDIKMV